MSQNHLKCAVNQCNNGHIPFYKQHLLAFFHEGYWYPIRSLVNYARTALHYSKVGTTECTKDLSRLFGTVVVKTVYFTNNSPMPVNGPIVVRPSWRGKNILEG